MKQYIILSLLLLAPCLFIKGKAQEIDTVPPQIFLSVDSLLKQLNKREDPPYIIDTTQKNKIIVALTCIYDFPEEFDDIPRPIIRDNIDPEPKDSMITIVDSINDAVIQKWIATDQSGNSSELEINVRIGTYYPFLLNQISLNEGIILYDLEGVRLDTMAFCSSANLIFTVNFSDYCPSYKNVFYWKINGKSALSSYGGNFEVSLNDLPQNILVELETTAHNSNIDESKYPGKIIKFHFRNNQEAVYNIMRPSCTGSNDGSISINEAYNITWEDNSHNKVRTGLPYGTYSVSYEKDSCSFTKVFDLLKKDSLYFELSDDTIDLKSKNYVQIRNTSTFRGPFQWQIGNDFLPNDSLEFQYPLNNSGEYTIHLTLKDGYCSDLYSKKLTVIDTREYRPDTIIKKPSCLGSANGSILISGIESVTWDDGSTSLLRENLNFGKYWITYFDGSKIDTFFIDLFQEKSLSFRVSADTVDLSEDATLSITNNSTLKGNYSWKIGGNVFERNDNTFDTILTEVGKLPIILTLKESNCKDSFGDTIEVIQSLPTLNDESLSEKMFKVISPVIDKQLKIISNGDKSYDIRITNLNGLTVHRQNNLNTGQAIIPVEDLPSGIYILQIIRNEFVLKKQKIVVM